MGSGRNLIINRYLNHMNSSQTKYLDYFWLPQNWIFVLGILTSIVATIYIGASIPQILSQIYLHFNDSEFSGNIQKLLLLFIAEYLSRVIYQYSLNRYVTDLLINVRSFSYSRFMKAVTDDSKDSDKGKFTLGEVLARLVNDSAAIMELVSSGSFAIFIDLLFIVSCLLSFLSIDLTLGLYLISIEVLFCFFFVFLSS